MASKSSASSAILSISLELLAVGVFTVMAGASSDMGTIMVLIMVSLWLMFMITESSVVGGLVNSLQTATGSK